MTKVLVTGGAGFIGSNLVRRLMSDGHEVVVVDAMRSEGGANVANLADVRDRLAAWIEADLSDQGAWETAVSGVTWVFHLAARTGHVESMTDPVGDLSANVVASLRLWQAIRERAPEATIVFTSTRQVYGRAQRRQVDERHGLAPPDINAVHKLAVEEYVRVRGRAERRDGVVLRLTNTYGPRMRVRDARQCFLGHWIRLALEGGEIPVFGDGQQRRDMCHVDDVVNALVAAPRLATPAVPTFNIGGHGMALRELAELVVLAAGRGSVQCVPFPADRQPIDIGSVAVDDSAFREAAGWTPRVSLDEGIRHTLAYYERSGRAYW